MRIGMVGLGRMGGGLSRRLVREGHHVVAFDVDRAAIARATGDGVVAAETVADLVGRLPVPRVVWLMLPAAVVGDVVDEVSELLAPGDVLVDGGNSLWRDTIARAARLADRGVRCADVGVSGGIRGSDEGYCLMVGGDRETVTLLEPVLASLVPGVGAASRTPGRQGPPSPAEQGWLHCGPPGAGHLVKMVHNGIEYGVMASYAEGFAILEAAGDVPGGDGRAEAQGYGFELDLPAVAEVWRRGSVIRSWLLDLVAQQFVADPDLERFDTAVDDSGEGRWTVQAAVDLGVPADTIASALFSRFSSRQASAFADRALSAMRAAFGGHGRAE